MLVVVWVVRDVLPQQADRCHHSGGPEFIDHLVSGRFLAAPVAVRECYEHSVGCVGAAQQPSRGLECGAGGGSIRC